MKDKAVIGLHSNSQCTETQYLASSYKEECWNEFLSLEPNLESLVASDTAKHRQTYQGRQKEEKVRCEDTRRGNCEITKEKHAPPRSHRLPKKKKKSKASQNTVNQQQKGPNGYGQSDTGDKES